MSISMTEEGELTSNFRAILIDLSTDSVGPFLEEMSIASEQKATLDKHFRWLIRGMGEGFEGIVSESLWCRFSDALREIKRRGDNPEQAMRALYNLSEGRNRWTWTLHLGWSDIARSWLDPDAPYEPTAVDAETFARFLELQRDQLVTLPARLREMETTLEDAWRRDVLSDWDAFIRDVFRPEMTPLFGAMIDNKLLRERAQAAVRAFTRKERDALHAEAVAYLASNASISWMREKDSLAKFYSFDETVACSEADWAAIVADVRRRGFPLNPIPWADPEQT